MKQNKKNKIHILQVYNHQILICSVFNVNYFAYNTSVMSVIFKNWVKNKNINIKKQNIVYLYCQIRQMF
jgi:hypothetical protein